MGCCSFFLANGVEHVARDLPPSDGHHGPASGFRASGGKRGEFHMGVCRHGCRQFEDGDIAVLV